jgi:hypothetical protein
LNDLKKGGGLMVFAINATGIARWARPTLAPAAFEVPIAAFDNLASAVAAFPVPLVGFEHSYVGPPVDSKKYSENRRNLMQQIQNRKR